MSATFLPGDDVQTPFGKGVVLETQNRDRVLVRVQDRTMRLSTRDLTRLAPIAGRRRGTRQSAEPPAGAPRLPARSARAVPGEIDLHGLTVEDALARAEEALSDAVLADLPELRLVHGRSGGRIRAALHRRLKDIPAVRAFRLDPRNPGVTIVAL